MANDADVDASEVLRNFNDFLKKGLPENLKGGMEKACLVVEGGAKKKCPAKSGVTRASITHAVEAKAVDIEGYIGSPLDSAVYTHQGTGIFAIEGNGRKNVPWVYCDEKGEFHSTEGIKPTPFITEAIEENKEQILQCFSEVIGK